MADTATLSRLTFGEMLGTYGKSLAAAIVACLSAYTTALQDGAGVSSGEVLVIIGAFVVTFGGVWAIPNVPDKVRKYGKLGTAAVLTVLSSLGTALTDGSLTQIEIVNALVALIGVTVLTGSVSNAASSDPVTATGKLIPIPADVKEAIGIEGTTPVSTADGQVSLGARYAKGGLVEPPQEEDAVTVVEEDPEKKAEG